MLSRGSSYVVPRHGAIPDSDWRNNRKVHYRWGASSRDLSRVSPPTDPGPQPYGAGGEIVMWTSRDEGQSWTKLKQLTHDSKLNHTYPAGQVDARPFYALWADGNPLERSDSQLYFTDREVSNVWRLPTRMNADYAAQEVAQSGPRKAQRDTKNIIRGSQYHCGALRKENCRATGSRCRRRCSRRRCSRRFRCSGRRANWRGRRRRRRSSCRDGESPACQPSGR